MLTKEQQAIAVKMAMGFETQGFANNLMDVFMESIIKSPRESVEPLLEFLRTSSPTTARLYNEVMYLR